MATSAGTVDTLSPTATERLRRRYARRHTLARAGIYLAAALSALICAAPFLWSLVTAFKQNRDLYNPENNPFFFNLATTPDHVLYLLRDTAFLTFVWNTLWVGLLVVAITLTLPVVAVAALFGAVLTFTDMTVVYILTRGGPTNATQVLASWAFIRGIEGGDVAQGAAVALFLFPLLLAAAIAILRAVRRMEVL